jgi:hypothetical protein
LLQEGIAMKLTFILAYMMEAVLAGAAIFIIFFDKGSLNPALTVGWLGRAGRLFRAHAWVYWVVLLFFISELPVAIAALLRAHKPAQFIAELLYPLLIVAVIVLVVRIRAANKYEHELGRQVE